MRTTTILLAAIGLVLVGVVVTRTPGQQVAGPNGACCYANGECIFQREQDCLENLGVWQGVGVPCEGLDCVGIICQTTPTVVTTAVTFDGYYRIWRTWSDGQVDMTLVTFGPNPSCVVNDFCGPVVILPGTCPTDIDRNGDTGITDFLTLLGEWGACK